MPGGRPDADDPPPRPVDRPAPAAWSAPDSVSRPAEGGVRRPLGAIVLVAALLVLAVVGGALLLGGGPVNGPSGLGPSLSAGPSTATPPSEGGEPSDTAASGGPSGTPASGSERPSASPDTDGPTQDPASISAAVEQIKDQVVAIRGLERRQDLPERILAPDALAEELRDLYRADNPAQEVASQERLLKRLGLLSPDADLEALVLELLGSAVAGFYNPDEEALVIVQRGTEFGPVERFTLAHEFNHALQDQHYDLDSLGVEDPDNSDRGLARRAYVEGDAQLLTAFWAQENLSLEELGRLLTESSDPEQQDVLARMPPILQRELIFPYADGLGLVQGIYGEGGWAAVNDGYQRPPESTEQVIHPEKYAAGEEPIPVELPEDMAITLGDGWEKVTEDTFGELYMQVWLDQVTGVDAHEAAAGWGGDRLAMYEGPDDAWAIAWDTRWDSDADATEFLDAAQQVVDAGTEQGDIIGPDDERVIIVLASDEAIVETLASRLEGP